MEEPDLAILRVRDVQDLPAPLSLPATSELAETMPVYCLGFPFGRLLAIGDSNPGLTVSKGSVSSNQWSPGTRFWPPWNRKNRAN